MRQMSQAPVCYDGTLAEMAREHIIPNMPAPDSIARIHEQIKCYLFTEDPLFLVRSVRGMERGPATGKRRDSSRCPAALLWIDLGALGVFSAVTGWLAAPAVAAARSPGWR